MFVKLYWVVNDVNALAQNVVTQFLAYYCSIPAIEMKYFINIRILTTLKTIDVMERGH